ncbi:divisome protein SepX/GlpR, partial [Wenjunlia vitaminophila]|uniref:divisome protein SepX/GlpR n=1 Tax=Wenjunlia vitaminophila TaxID=76728 RepID=UPI00191C6B6B
MSSSGLIYAVIVGAWAAYLVPMWLRRQDELNEARPTERFSTAIRLLSGRAAMERRYARNPSDLPDAEDAAPHSDAASDPDDPSPAGPPANEPATADAAHPDGQVDVRDLAVPVRARQPQPGYAGGTRRDRVLARRRRTTVVLFLTFTAGAVAAAIVGLKLLWLPAVPGVLLTAYIAYLRRQERRRYAIRLDQRAAAEAARRLRDRAPRRAAPRPRHPPAASPPARRTPRTRRTTRRNGRPPRSRSTPRRRSRRPAVPWSRRPTTPSGWTASAPPPTRTAGSRSRCRCPPTSPPRSPPAARGTSTSAPQAPGAPAAPPTPPPGTPRRPTPRPRPRSNPAAPARAHSPAERVCTTW